MSSDAQIEEIEVKINEAKEVIERKKALMRLTDNKDFKSIVLDGYFKDEASRLVLLKADYEMQDEMSQNQIKKSIDAIGYFRLYLRTVMQLGAQMEKDLAADEQTREELLSE